MTNSKPMVLCVMEDLMFMVRIQEAARRVGLETVVVKTREKAISKAADGAALCIIDLNYRSGEPLELITALKADEGTKGLQLVAFVSHVQTDLRAAAASAGCDVVLARSAFVENLNGILERATGPDAVSSQQPR